LRSGDSGHAKAGRKRPAGSGAAAAQQAPRPAGKPAPKPAQAKAADREEGERGRLEAYRRKRSAERSPEPFGTGAGGGSGLFVVQQHWARHKHFDLRLEIGGALHSWAVPKGPSPNPADKRLAMEVEDHPLEYGDFEGLIPEGNYGAGAVIVFDQGRWVPAGDPHAGLRDGKLLFDLHGHKLRGRWTLFRTKGGPANGWLLVKKPDAFAAAESGYSPRSILSGRTVEELREGADAAGPLRRRLQRLGAPRRELRAADVEPMLARTAEGPFSRKGWLFELKYDGFRLIAAREGGSPRLRYRGGEDVTERFPEIAASLRVLPYDGLVLDGELVVLDAEGKPSFSLLQQRVQATRRAEVAVARVRLQTLLYVFDLLAAEGHDLRPLPLVRRRELLGLVLPPTGPLRLADQVAEDGERMFAEVGRLGFEGIVAKQAAAPYRGGRSDAWLKIRADRSGDFVIVGFTAPAGSRSGFGALHLAAHAGGSLVYAGRVGTGFDGRQIRELHRQLQALVRRTPPVAGPAPAAEGSSWVEPRLVCEVRYKERTRDGMLRHPVFVRLRDDKPPAECELPPAAGAPERALPPRAPQPVERRVAFSNLDKVFWPADGSTKGDLIAYYRAVADRLLPLLRDRPIVLTRYPDGIEGKSFYQKDAPAFVPDWLRTETMWSEHAEREIRYFICDDVESLLYVVNLGSILLHLWSSRVASLQNPDWCILDLDPKDAPFRNVVRVALALRALCLEIGLECFVKTSGSSGLHVLVPLGRGCTYEQSRWLAQLLGAVIAAEHPDLATLIRPVAARGARVYIDCLQNGHGKLLVAPFSARPLPGAPVSAPLAWSEVNARLDLRRYTIHTLPARLRRQRRDPWAGLLQITPDLDTALERLAARVG